MKWYEYNENNSGGDRWLTDDDQLNLIRAGWIVYKRMFDLTEAYKQFPSQEAAVAEWESITGQSVDEEGCPCCGQPHSIYDTNDNWQEYMDSPENTYSTRLYDVIDTTGSIVDRKALTAG